MENGRRRAAIIVWTLITLALAAGLQRILVRVAQYRDLYDRFPFFVPESFKSGIQILLALVAVVILHRITLGEAFAELGIRRPAARMIGVMALATVPMWLIFALTTPLATGVSLAGVLYLAVLSPFAEEIVFRGFAFRQLYRRASLGFWTSVLLTSAVFSLVHLQKASSVGQVVGIAVITFIGGAFFAWLFVRWDDNLFAPLIVHSLMNLAWQVFSVGESAFAGWLPTVLQASVLAFAVTLTLLVQRSRESIQPVARERVLRPDPRIR